jgi:WD repeat-containing protein 23
MLTGCATATAWNGWGSVTGTVTVHSWNAGADDDEGLPRMGTKVNHLLQQDADQFGSDAETYPGRRPRRNV